MESKTKTIKLWLSLKISLLTLSWGRPLSYRNQSTDLLCISIRFILQKFCFIVRSKWSLMVLFWYFYPELRVNPIELGVHFCLRHVFSWLWENKESWESEIFMKFLKFIKVFGAITISEKKCIKGEVVHVSGPSPSPKNFRFTV